MPHKVSDRPPDMIDHRTLDDTIKSPIRTGSPPYCSSGGRKYDVSKILMKILYCPQLSQRPKFPQLTVALESSEAKNSAHGLNAWFTST